MTTNWRTDLEVTLGGVQLRAMERAVSFAARLEIARTDDGVVYTSRPGRRGLPVTCVHGFGGDKEAWILMAAMMPRARGVAAIDLLGHGASIDVPVDRASVRHQAEAVLRVMDHAGIDRTIVVGNSMGGGIALRLAQSYPARVAGLVLVASVGRDIHESAAQSWVDGENPLIPRVEDVDKFMAIALERPPPVGKAVIRHVIMQRAKKADQLHRLFKGFMTNGDEPNGVPRDLAQITCPALVIHGEQDRIISKEVGLDLVAALPRSELVVLRGVGHGPHLEAPRMMGRILERFAERVERST
ncbi:MAG TPA: alpha/beta fold hydrolase [Kofleriaceae bacterium]